ncbi:GTP cyclohydrolase IIa [Psychrobacillus sp. NPDC096389]|uniref:GTP cyclohydrolase IIa n=1 Tax=Psychrobacillus sp. NPDC096389 TaxID=3364490 RepID=UPI003821224D
METNIKVGVIGPLWIRETLIRCFDLFPTILPIFRLSDEIEEAKDFTVELRESVDCLFYSGRIPYLVAKEEVPIDVPAFYIPLKGSGLYQALYKLKGKNNLAHISFDGIPNEYIEIVKNNLEETFTYTNFKDIVSVDNVNGIVDYHLNNIAKDTSTVVITSLKLVSESLTNKNITNEWLKPSEEDTIVVIERMLLATNQRKQKEMQIILGRIFIENSAVKMNEFMTEHQVQKRNHDIYRMLLHFAEQMNGYLTALSSDEYLFVTNRGVFERITEGYKSLPILNEVKKKLGVQLSIGIGFGFTALEAGSHARVALTQARDSGGSCCFIVREDRSVFGPIDIIAPMKYPLAVTDQLLIHQAELTGMSAANIEKTIALIKRKKKNEFTAHELSSVLGITPRSAHRIVQSWLDASLIEIIGTEKVSKRGRPRQVFSLLNDKGMYL